MLTGGRRDETAIERRGKEEGDGDVSSAAADATEPGGGVSAVGKRKSECALRLLLGYFLNVSHFTIKVRYVSVCVLIICLPRQDFLLCSE